MFFILYIYITLESNIKNYKDEKSLQKGFWFNFKDKIKVIKTFCVESLINLKNIIKYYYILFLFNGVRKIKKILQIIYLLYFINIFFLGIKNCFIIISPLWFKSDILKLLFELLLPTAYCMDNNIHNNINNGINRMYIIQLFNSLPENSFNQVLDAEYPILTDPEVFRIHQSLEPDTTLSELEALLRRRVTDSKTLFCFSSINAIEGLNFDQLINRENGIYTLIQNISFESNMLYLSSLDWMRTLYHFEPETDWKIEFKNSLWEMYHSNEKYLYLHNVACQKIFSSYFDNFNEMNIINEKKNVLSEFVEMDSSNYIYDNFLPLDNNIILSKYLSIHKNLFVFLKTFNLSVLEQIHYLENDNNSLHDIITNVNFSKFSDMYLYTASNNILTIENFSSNFPDILQHQNLRENPDNVQKLVVLETLNGVNLKDYLKVVDTDITAFQNNGNNIRVEINHNYFRNFFSTLNALNQSFIDVYNNNQNNLIPIIENKGFLINHNHIELQNQVQNDNNFIRNVRQRLNY